MQKDFPNVEHGNVHDPGIGMCSWRDDMPRTLVLLESDDI